MNVGCCSCGLRGCTWCDPAYYTSMPRYEPADPLELAERINRLMNPPKHGWTCPKCDVVNGPHVDQCPCSVKVSATSVVVSATEGLPSC